MSQVQKVSYFIKAAVAPIERESSSGNWSLSSSKGKSCMLGRVPGTTDQACEKQRDDIQSEIKQRQ